MSSPPGVASARHVPPGGAPRPALGRAPGLTPGSASPRRRPGSHRPVALRAGPGSPPRRPHAPAQRAARARREAAGGTGPQSQGGRKGPGLGFPRTFKRYVLAPPLPVGPPRLLRPRVVRPEFVFVPLVLPSARLPGRGVRRPRARRTSPWWAPSRSLEPAWVPGRLPMGEAGGGFGVQRKPSGYSRGPQGWGCRARQPEEGCGFLPLPAFLLLKSPRPRPWGRCAPVRFPAAR